MSLLWITLYSIYFISFKNNLTKFAGLFFSSADIFLSSSGFTMNSTALNTQSSLPINFPLSNLSSNRTASSGTSITASVIAKLLNRLSPTKTRGVLSPQILYAPSAGLLTSISTTTPAAVDSSSARSADGPL